LAIKVGFIFGNLKRAEVKAISTEKHDAEIIYLNISKISWGCAQGVKVCRI